MCLFQVEPHVKHNFCWDKEGFQIAFQEQDLGARGLS